MYPMGSIGPLRITGRKQPSITKTTGFRRGLFATLGEWGKGAAMLETSTVYKHLPGVKLWASVGKSNELITHIGKHGLTRVKTTYDVRFCLELSMVLPPEGILRANSHSKRYAKQDRIGDVRRIEIVTIRSIPYMREFKAKP